MRYYLLFYTDNIKEGFAGQANGPVIRIRPAYKDDIDLKRLTGDYEGKVLALHGLG